jgi:hypothetical protein
LRKRRADATKELTAGEFDSSVFGSFVPDTRRKALIHVNVITPSASYAFFGRRSRIHREFGKLKRMKKEENPK